MVTSGENHHFSWENPLNMSIFNSYVKLPKGTGFVMTYGDLWGFHGDL